MFIMSSRGDWPGGLDVTWEMMVLSINHHWLTTILDLGGGDGNAWLGFVSIDVLVLLFKIK